MKTVEEILKNPKDHPMQEFLNALQIMAVRNGACPTGWRINRTDFDRLMAEMFPSSNDGICDNISIDIGDDFDVQIRPSDRRRPISNYELVKATNGCCYNGSQPIDTEGRDVVVKYHTSDKSDPILIADAGHFIGTAKLKGGLSYQCEYASYAWRNFALLDGNTLHTILFVNGSPSMVESPHIPAPFDRFKIGAEKMPRQTGAL